MVTLDEAGRGALGARLGRVGGASRAFVEHDFVLDFREVRRTRWKIMPDPAGHLLVHLERHGSDLRARPGVVVGARSRAVETDVSPRAWTVGVRLRTGALPALTGLPARELTDRAVAAADIWGPLAEELDGRIGDRAGEGPEAVRAVLLRFVEERARRSVDPSWVARALEGGADGGATFRSVTDLAARLGIAPRTLRARANHEVGLSPKRIARIDRLFAALRIIAPEPALLPSCARSTSTRSRAAPPWSEVAARCGFTDQSHLVREFRALLGESPGAFSSRALA